MTLGWRYWAFDPPHPHAWQGIEWVIGDEECPSVDRPTCENSVVVLEREKAGHWNCSGVWWRPARTLPSGSMSSIRCRKPGSIS